MATAESKPKIDLNALMARVSAQFRGLDPNEPGQWPLVPKLAAFIGVGVAVLAATWFFFLADIDKQLEMARNQEPTLKQDFQLKLRQAINLNELSQQKLQVEGYVTQLEKQLPGKAEMDALLSDINQAGLGRGLQFELFRPGQVVVKDYYAELPISIKVAGRYHDIGAFAGDIANLSRIVTLHDMAIQAPTQRDASGTLSMEATARTYRYLDEGEIVEQRKLVQAAKSGARK